MTSLRGWESQESFIILTRENSPVKALPHLIHHGLSFEICRPLTALLEPSGRYKESCLEYLNRMRKCFTEKSKKSPSYIKFKESSRREITLALIKKPIPASKVDTMLWLSSNTKLYCTLHRISTWSAVLSPVQSTFCFMPVFLFCLSFCFVETTTSCFIHFLIPVKCEQAE